MGANSGYSRHHGHVQGFKKDFSPTNDYPGYMHCQKKDYSRRCDYCKLLPSVVLQRKSPYEIFYGKKPSIDHLRTMGCLCFAKKLPAQDKFGARAIEARIPFPFKCKTTASTQDPFFHDIPLASDVLPIYFPTSPPTSDPSPPPPDTSEPFTPTVDPNLNPISKPPSVDPPVPTLIESQRSYVGLRPLCKQSLAAFTSVVEPQSFQEASSDPLSVDAMISKLQDLIDYKTWKLVPLPPGKTPIGVVISIAASFDWPIYQMDVHNAFLQGYLHDEGLLGSQVQALSPVGVGLPGRFD
ncbi:uncharacterized protein LOC124889632 [Capsicum annuum]|uniref:uncharacterized protein LOC124889632 n=1 Tax=Capsicum annuum TaxID=4072 RepID=UPI001FB07057|nr:uncharacterized protein LOC124889632 [Capsicum annuum]